MCACRLIIRNCLIRENDHPGNVFPGNVFPGKWPSGKRLSGKKTIRESNHPGNYCKPPMSICLSLIIVQKLQNVFVDNSTVWTRKTHYYSWATNLRWRTHLYRKVTNAGATIYFCCWRLIVSAIGVIHLLVLVKVFDAVVWTPSCSVSHVALLV